mmetsp:Transcript_58838/g.162738  ORF Transcript_58838/g.162738 Transcript_58838/m.162738 type:complete len:281 (-) Transcript_58838:1338-2180(-)
MGSIAKSGSAVASTAAASSSADTATKATSAPLAATASRSRTPRSSTCSSASCDERTPLSTAKPVGAKASPMTSPFNWRSKYSRRLLARTPESFSLSTLPCTCSSTSGGALAMNGDSANGAMDSRPGPSNLPSSSSSSVTRSQRHSAASATRKDEWPFRPSSSNNGRPCSRRTCNMVLSGLSSAAAVAKPRSDSRCVPIAAARSRLQRLRTAGQLPQMPVNSSLRSGQGTPANSSVSTRSHCPALAQCDTRVSAIVRSTVPSTTERFAGRRSTLVRSPPNG